MEHVSPAKHQFEANADMLQTGANCRELSADHGTDTWTFTDHLMLRYALVYMLAALDGIGIAIPIGLAFTGENATEHSERSIAPFWNRRRYTSVSLTHPINFCLAALYFFDASCARSSCSHD